MQAITAARIDGLSTSDSQVIKLFLFESSLLSEDFYEQRKSDNVKSNDYYSFDFKATSTSWRLQPILNK